jgi:hypothetical protein
MKRGSKLLASLDLSNADTLEFWSPSAPIDLLSTPIPSQLTTLKLDLVVFTPESLPSGRRHFLPCLTSLTLLSVAFIGPMRNYFHCPKLFHLHYHIKADYYIFYNIVEECRNPYQALTRKTFDEAFFQETPALESIFLGGTALDDALALTLAFCPVLHSLTIKRCYIEEFVHPFLESLQDLKYLPSLRILHIDDSWPIRLDLSFTEFVGECSSKRPRLDIISNKRVVDPEEFYDSDFSQSGYGASSDADGDSEPS